MSPASNDPAIVIIGSGFAGLCMAIRLKQAGYHHFVILEKDDDLGGTWRITGIQAAVRRAVACIHSRSSSIRAGPGCSRRSARSGSTCSDALISTASPPHIRYGCSVEGMEWDQAIERWRIATAAGEVYTARAVVSGVGSLHLPSSSRFLVPTSSAGAAFTRRNGTAPATFLASGSRSSRTGASAIQFIPEIAKQAARVYVFQRTPPWIHPRLRF
jgi:cation diffusion facilitator CzcD-associated flavoprotein CzcO